MHLSSLSFVLLVATCGFGTSVEVSKPISNAANTQNTGDSINLAKPSIDLTLSATLNEISGITWLPQTQQIAAVQDEIGTVYLLDPKSGNIASSSAFQVKGDFESIELVGDSLYALRSSGILYTLALKDVQQGDHKHEGRAIGLQKAENIEGLGYNANMGMLLMAAKGNKDSVATRTIWQYNVKTSTLDTKPWTTIEPSAFEKWMLQAKKADGSAYKAKNAEDTVFKFAPSGIAVHPVSGQVYILSSVGKWLLVLDANAKFISLTKLDKNLLPQPEGIMFDSENHLWISTEAKDGNSAHLMRF